MSQVLFQAQELKGPTLHFENGASLASMHFTFNLLSPLNLKDFRDKNEANEKFSMKKWIIL